jgi:NADH-quinone oxidoreductase subunit H
VSWFLEILKAILAAVVIFTFLAVVGAMLGVYLERKISGWIQSRLGPKHVGPQGILQTIADTVKLLQKENIVPASADPLTFNVAPLMAVVAALLGWIIIPFGPAFGRVLVVRDINIGLLFFIAMASLIVIATLLGGWASNNKYALLGGFRSASQMISYEIPLALAVMVPIMMAGTLSTVGIVEAQRGGSLGIGNWFIFGLPGNRWLLVPALLAFLVFVTAASAEVNRVPFDLPEAESELVAGYFSEYTGMRFALFQLGEYAEAFAMAALTSVLFLGGWHGPVLPGVAWFFIKMFALVFFLIWMRWTYPRLRLDQLLNLSWKGLVPIGFALVLVTGWLLV